MQGTDPLRIVLLGKDGAGKSSLANTIFGGNVFQVERTRCLQVKAKVINGRNVTLIDTPGLFDVGGAEEKMDIVRCVRECAPGPHAFLIVLKIERFTQQEATVISKIQECFSEDVFKYAVLVFTHGDQLPEGREIQQFVHGSSGLHDLVSRCGGRCHVFDNRYWKNKQQDEYRSNQFQVGELLSTIEKMVEEHHGGCYTNEMLKKAERKKQPGKILAAVMNFVFVLLRALLGTTTGALLSALLGLPMIVASLCVAVRSPAAAAATLAQVAVAVVKGAYTGYCAARRAKDLPEAAVCAFTDVKSSILKPFSRQDKPIK